MRRILPESVLEEVGRLDPAAIEQVREEAWPDVRDADELHDVLHTLIAVPEDIGQSPIDAMLATHITEWRDYFVRLVEEGRAGVAISDATSRRYWVAAERAQTFAILYPGTSFEKTPAKV